MSKEAVTSQRHNEYVGMDANVGRIPGAGDAASGHHYVSVFPKGQFIVIHRVALTKIM